MSQINGTQLLREIMESPKASWSQLASDALCGHYAGVTTFSPEEMESLVQIIRESMRGARDAV